MVGKSKIKKQKGITLLTLVITIIVLLILAGVSLSTLIGNNGIIKRAETSEEIHIKESLREKLEVLKGNIQLKDKGQVVVETYEKELLEEEIVPEEEILYNDDESIEFVSEEGYLVLVKPNPENEGDVIIEIEGKADNLPAKIAKINLTAGTNKINVSLEVRRAAGATYKYYYKETTEEEFKQWGEETPETSIRM